MDRTKTKKFKVKSVSELDLMISYESVDETMRVDDDFETKEAWDRQIAFILQEAERQGTDEPIIELETEE